MNLLGEFIQQKRAEKKLSLRDVAVAAEISPSQLSKLERGLVKTPSNDTLVKIAYALNVDKDDLLALAGKIDIPSVTLNYDKDFFDKLARLSIEAFASAEIAASDAASLIDQLIDIVEYRNQELAEEDVLFVAKEMEAAYELAIRRLKNKQI